MKVKTKIRFMEFFVALKDPRYKNRSAKITMELESDGKWHHYGTIFHGINKDKKTDGGKGYCCNLADMVFVGEVSKEIIKIKEQLNGKY